ncbi:MAG: S8 family peptidase [Bacillota bacterium]
MPIPDGHYHHIRWRRLPDAAVRRSGPPSMARPPLRRDVAEHGRVLHQQVQEAFQTNEAGRRISGVDPATLLVLELAFLEISGREHLERLGVQLIEEQQRKESVSPPYYALLLRFETPDHLESFVERVDQDSMGILSIERQRASGGSIDPIRLEVCFAERDAAIQFMSNEQQAQNLRYGITSQKPSKKSFRTLHNLLVQFEDREANSRFQDELRSYQASRLERDRLTANQRRELFDSMIGARSLGPNDRRGIRLQTQELTDADGLYYFDVDLWHPGRALVARAIGQFREVVERAGGRVTDPPTSVADTLLLARVQGTNQTLEALLNYDRVALVDLPPQGLVPEFSIFDPIELPSDVPVLPDDGPLACVVDSGIVAGHPLLSGVVVDERDFDSGENTPVDKVGHGTHMAGIVVYGDIVDCLRRNSWLPRVRLLSAKVMRRLENDQVGFGDEKRVETQVREAITAFVREYSCRVFNISFGHQFRQYRGGRQLPWAQMLDELARELDIVIVVSSGNVGSPAIPVASTSASFQEAVREQLLTDEHALIDPATAALSLTVGSVARGETSFQATTKPAHRPPLVGSPAGCPSPFTRSGTLSESGMGVSRGIKPELTAFGGNSSLIAGTNWRKQDPLLGEPSLRFDYQGTRLLSVACGTSVSAAHVTHCCAVIADELRRANPRGTPPSANLIRCLAVHSARVSEQAARWMGEGYTEAEAEKRILRTIGFGQPDINRAAFSTEQRTTLIAEDEIPLDHFHLYEIELPDEFVTRSGRRSVRVTLAYDPPIRGTRKDYLANTMWFQIYRGLTADEIRNAMSLARGVGTQPRISQSNVVNARPPYTSLEWSTVQCAVYKSQSRRPFNYRPDPNGSVIWHLLVGCNSRFAGNETGNQRYAIAVSLEHSDAQIRLYQTVRQRVEQRIRIYWPHS